MIEFFMNYYYNISSLGNIRNFNIMVSLLSVSKAQIQISLHVRDRRLAMGLTQEGLASRSGVALPTLRKFEQKGLISLESLLKLLLVLDGLENVVKALEPERSEFSSIDEVLDTSAAKTPKKGWRK